MPSSARPALLVRADGTARIGSGHLTRCRALALALRESGAEAAFAVLEDSLEQAAPLCRDGFDVRVLPGCDPAALDAGDLAATVEAAGTLGAGAVLVDHYGADGDYLGRLAAAGLAVAAIDDLGLRDHSAATWVLNQNLGAPRDAYPGVAHVLRGPRYALLRPEFAASRANLERDFTADDFRVLVTLGGGVNDGLLGGVLAALDAIARPLAITVVLGSDRLVPAVVEATVVETRHDVEVIGAARTMARLMARADVAVCAGGSTLWELACLGLPAVATVISRDQEPNVRACTTAGTAVAFDFACPFEAAEAVSRLLTDPARRRSMAEAGQEIADGRGAERAAASLLTALARSEAVVDAVR